MFFLYFAFWQGAIRALFRPAPASRTADQPKRGADSAAAQPGKVRLVTPVQPSTNHEASPIRQEPEPSQLASAEPQNASPQEADFEQAQSKAIEAPPKRRPPRPRRRPAA